MATPVKTGSNVPATATTITPAEPVHVVGPVGWVLILSSGIGLILATWMLYPLDAEGMWAGYRGGFTATIVVTCAMALCSSLPKKPIIGLLGICGILLVLFGVFLDNSHVVFLSEVIAGAVLLAGTGMYAAGNRD
ncbi:hypothetical protein [Nocardioides sp. SR21]|uniref:hypothetical protein n=1 Tax=Nocardioides sp. SR21 TaxID=2919501 RepID=UPI001FAB2E21|nr:hypothetical protein [Nocardioides sp. SR21]